MLLRRLVCETKYFASTMLVYFSLIIFVFNNLDSFRTNSLLHDFNTKSKHPLYFLSVKLMSDKKGVTYSAIKILISYPQTYWNCKNSEQL